MRARTLLAMPDSSLASMYCKWLEDCYCSSWEPDGADAFLKDMVTDNDEDFVISAQKTVDYIKSKLQDIVDANE